MCHSDWSCVEEDMVSPEPLLLLPSRYLSTGKATGGSKVLKNVGGGLPRCVNENRLGPLGASIGSVYPRLQRQAKG